MKRNLLYIVIFTLLSSIVYSQDESIYEDLLREVVEVENPVYKPVVGMGIGMFGFIGDVKNNQGNLLFNKPAYKINVSTFVSKKKGFRANFTFLTGSISANQRSINNPVENLNFQSEIYSFGLNLEYGFGDLTKTNRKIMPFISLGVELFQFTPKTDYSFKATLEDVQDGAAISEGQLIPYHYWTDGTIRNLDETEANIFNSRIVERDYKVDADLRNDFNFGYGSYSQNTVAIPIDLGFDFTVSNRLTVRLGTSLHYAFTDYLDHVTPKNNRGISANSWNDMFTCTYLTIHLDLFSEAKTYVLEKLVADFEDFDYTFLEDEDGDYVWDHVDNCPETPMNTPVDSVGCPFDDDYDGVPNYLDKEPNTPAGAIVNDEGVQMTEDELIALLDNSSAVPRKDIDLYIRKIDDITYSKYYGISNLEIPEKFKTVDSDGDGYISFDEVLDTIDKFFEFESTLSTEDIYELNEFFFAQ